jgi:nitrite reductase/ring-hydroxylating ferredoxin subunit
MSEFVKVAKVADLKPGQAKAIQVDDSCRIALFNVGGNYYALDDFCPHKGAPLVSGLVGGKTVSCEWHGATFDLETGTTVAGPGGQGVQSYKVRTVDDDIEVEV